MSPENKSPIVGIDLGTTNSVVAGLINGKVQILEEDGQKLLPSVVGIDGKGKLITGVVARNQLAAFPERTIASVKRKMGSTEKIALDDQQFTPQEISAMILWRLRDRASRVLGQSVERAVITVPAFFDESQRQATREAGLLAGLKVERIINEPTAATLVYHAGGEDQKHVVVYDFGGGTFDVSVVRFESGVVEVLSSKGDTQLGGDDLDQLLVDYVAKGFLKRHGIDLRENLSTKYRLLQACEAAKCSLSQSASTTIAEEFIAEKDGQPINLELTISRQHFEKLIRPLVDKTVESVDLALRDSGLTLKDIDDLVLVGGSTRIPLVEHRLTEEFQLNPSRAVDPDLAVALGAATQAAMIGGTSIGPVLVDVTGHTLGLKVVSDNAMGMPELVFAPMIRRNSPLPASFEEVYSKTHEDQTGCVINVLQGESMRIEDNHPIGQFNLDLEAGEDASESIIVRFDLTLDGVLKVTAAQEATGKSEELVIDNALSKFQGEDRERAVARLGSMFDSSDEILDGHDLPTQDWQGSGADTKAGIKIANMEKFPAAISLLEQAKSTTGIPAEDLADIKKVSRKLTDAVAKNEAKQVMALCQELDDILFYVEG